MKTITFNGKDYNCLEHMKEIKATSNGELFNRFYNKKQMFNFFLGKDQRNIEGEKTVEPINDDYDDDLGIASGLWVYSGSWCGVVELFKLENVDVNTFENWDVHEAVKEDKLFYLDTFFVEDDNGQTWLVYTNVD